MTLDLFGVLLGCAVALSWPALARIGPLHTLQPGKGLEVRAVGIPPADRKTK